MTDNTAYLFRVETIAGVGNVVTAFYAPGDTVPTGVELSPPSSKIAILLARQLRQQFRMGNESFDSFARAPAPYLMKDIEAKTYDIFIEEPFVHRGRASATRTAHQQGLTFEEARKACAEQDDYELYVAVDDNGNAIFFKDGQPIPCPGWKAA